MFYEQLKKLCEEKNIKMTPLIKKLNISAGSVTNWKNGASANSEIVIKIANYFNVSTDYLLLGKETNITEDEKTLILNYRKLSERRKGKAEEKIQQLIEEQEEQENKDFAVLHPKSEIC